VKGSIIHIDHSTGAGLLRGEDGRRYSFDLSNWLGEESPSIRDEVDFEPISGSATEICLIKSALLIEEPVTPPDQQSSHADASGLTEEPSSPPPPPPFIQPAQNSDGHRPEAWERLAKLRDAGALTDAEFEAAKKKMLAVTSKPCRRCGAQVGLDARVCPKCGLINPVAETAEPASEAVAHVTTSVEPVSRSSNAAWYYERSGESIGPITETAIKLLLKSNDIHPETLVWREAFGATWKQAQGTELYYNKKAPPLLPAEPINDAAAWLLAFYPAIGAVVAVIFGVNQNLTELGHISEAIPVLLFIVDRIAVQKYAVAGFMHFPLCRGALWLLYILPIAFFPPIAVPFYLYRRARHTHESLAIFWTSIAILAIWAYIVYHMFVIGAGQ